MTEEGDLLVGADGLRSKVREKLGLGADDGPTFTGRIAFRATLAAETLGRAAREPEVTLRLGAARASRAISAARGADVNLVAVIEAGWRERPAGSSLGRRSRPPGAAARFRRLVGARARADRRRQELARLAALPSPAARLLCGGPRRAGRATRRIRWSRFSRKARRRRSRTPGALARASRRAQDVAAALAAYSRRARAARRPACSARRWRRRRIYHMSGPFALARDLAMRALGPERLLKRYDWLYGAWRPMVDEANLQRLRERYGRRSAARCSIRISSAVAEQPVHGRRTPQMAVRRCRDAARRALSARGA